MKPREKLEKEISVTTDEGIDAWAVFVEGMIRCHSIASTKEAVEEQLAFFESMHNKKCTVEAVTIYRKEKK